MLIGISKDRCFKSNHDIVSDGLNGYIKSCLTIVSAALYKDVLLIKFDVIKLNLFTLYEKKLFNYILIC